MKASCVFYLAILLVLLAGCATVVPTATPTPTNTPIVAPMPTSTATVPAATSTITMSPTATMVSAATPTNTPTVLFSPTSDPRHLLVAFYSDLGRNDDIYLYDPASGDLFNVTNSPSQERDPAFSADGRWLYYRSNASGSWAFYRLDLVTGERERLPGDDRSTTAYCGHLVPWPSVPGSWDFVYESYQDGHLSLYAQSVHGQHAPLLPAPPTTVNERAQEVPTGYYDPALRPLDDARMPHSVQIAYVSWETGRKALYLADVQSTHALTPTTLLVDSPWAEEDPAWSLDGQRLVFVRWQNHDADLYELDLPTGEVHRLTDDPYPDRSPVYAPDGTLFWTRYVPGPDFELHDPLRRGQWTLMAQMGRQQDADIVLDGMDVYAPAVALAHWPNWPNPGLNAPVPLPTLAPDQLAGLVPLNIDCAGGDARLNARLVEDYQQLRATVLDQSGYDLMGRISDMFRPPGYSGRNYGHLSWHRTGRTFDLLFEWYDPPDSPNHLLVMRENLGAQTYWRLYLRAAVQDGSMGEPIMQAPWIFWFNLDPAKEPDQYAAGGKPGVIPPGYYIDITRLLGQYGWHRIAAYEEDDFDWRWDSVGREFWHYQRSDGLTWWEAMSEIYDQETLNTYYGWPVCSDTLGLDASWLLPKGIPTLTPETPQTEAN